MAKEEKYKLFDYKHTRNIEYRLWYEGHEHKFSTTRYNYLDIDFDIRLILNNNVYTSVKVDRIRITKGKKRSTDRIKLINYDWDMKVTIKGLEELNYEGGSISKKKLNLLTSVVSELMNNNYELKSTNMNLDTLKYLDTMIELS